MKYLIALFALTLTACTGWKGGTTVGNPYSEDTSASGAVAQAAGGALSSSSADGLVAYFKYSKPVQNVDRWEILSLLPKAHAAGFCPTYLTSAGPKCSASGATQWLDYDNCTFPGGSAVRNGTQAMIMSAGAAACGTFPNPGASESLYRQFVASLGSTAPDKMYIRSGFGTLGVVDHESADLANFDGVTINTLINGGYGSRVDFNGSGERSAVTLRQRIAVAGRYDHSIDGSLTITTTGATTRELDGTVTVYMNVARVIGTSTFTDVVHSNMCCVPTAGTVSTTFTAGANVVPTAAGALLVGRTESLTFTGCGTAEYTDHNGGVSNVYLSRCF